MIHEENEMTDEKRIGLDPEEMSLICEALGDFVVSRERQGAHVEVARAEILIMRIRNGYHRKNKYNTDLLYKATLKQNAQE